jgi:hypothetical protein
VERRRIGAGGRVGNGTDVAQVVSEETVAVNASGLRELFSAASRARNNDESRLEAQLLNVPDVCSR